jgi:hypothetical protein
MFNERSIETEQDYLESTKSSMHGWKSEDQGGTLPGLLPTNEASIITPYTLTQVQAIRCITRYERS